MKLGLTIPDYMAAVLRVHPGNLLIFCFILISAVGEKIPLHHESWAVHIPGGVEHAKVVANATGGIFLGQVGHLHNIYHITQVRLEARSD